VTTASPTGFLRLFHGTLGLHVSSICQRIDFMKSAGFFWMTPDVDRARYFADLAEQQLLFVGGPPGQAIFSCDVPITTLESFQGQEPDPWLVVYSQGYRFGQACSAELHQAMQNIEITYEQ